MGKEWIDNIKIGDKVIVKISFYGVIYEYRVCKIDKISPKRGDITVNGDTFYKEGTSRNRSGELIEYTPKNLTIVRQFNKFCKVRTWCRSLELKVSEYQLINELNRVMDNQIKGVYNEKHEGD